MEKRKVDGKIWAHGRDASWNVPALRVRCRLAHAGAGDFIEALREALASA
jgi:hypothetical protein